MWGAGMAAERQERTGGEAKLTSAHLLQWVQCAPSHLRHTPAWGLRKWQERCDWPAASASASCSCWLVSVERTGVDPTVCMCSDAMMALTFNLHSLDSFVAVCYRRGRRVLSFFGASGRLRLGSGSCNAHQYILHALAPPSCDYDAMVPSSALRQTSGMKSGDNPAATELLPSAPPPPLATPPSRTRPSVSTYVP
jgi:hypothetical protein